MDNKIERKWLNLNQASYIANESIQTLRRRIDLKVLRATQRTARGKWLIHKNDLDRYMEVR